MTRTKWHNCQPADLHRLARDWFVNARRIELQKLALTLGISRATAYRWAGSAEQLVGEVLASLVDETFTRIVRSTPGHGSVKVLKVLEQLIRQAHQFQPLRKFLARNPQAGLRIVASRHGPVQQRTVANIETLLRDEAASGHLTLTADPAVMAFGLTRIAESFLYADLITGTRLDLDDAAKILKLTLGET